MGGEFVPARGQFVRISMELKWRKGLSKKEFEEWKEALNIIADRFGATITSRERIIMAKARRK